jgi:signal transduction histidine kinase
VTGIERLRSIDLFAGLDDADLDALAEAARQRAVDRGGRLFTEGDPGEEAYVITSGEVEILKDSQGREVLLAVRGPGDVIGEMALLESAPRMATARARTDTAFLVIPKAQFDTVLETSNSAARAMFGVLLSRWRETESRLRQSERMAQLGTLTAGIAHEINNPAAAVQRAATGLGEAVDAYGRAREEAAAYGMPEALVAAVERVATGDAPPRLDPIARSDAEAALDDWLTERGVDDAWSSAGALVDIGVSADDLDALCDDLEALPSRVRLLTAAGSLHSLLRQVTEGSARVFEIVKALKGYSYLDQAPIQDVRVTDGIDDTLLLLRSKIGDTRVEREYKDVPEIPAYGSELNQVWTNLIDNAVDAIGGGAGTIVIRVGTEDDRLFVEVQDDGPGISDDVIPRVFDSFFTTKEPGKGTGLGLDISYGIVVYRHGGDITVKETGPNGTTFRVELPLDGPPSADG